MCSACITSSPPASKSAVEQSWRSLMLAEWAERISVAPISSQAARRPPISTCSVIGSRLCHRPWRMLPGARAIVPASVDLGRPARGQDEGRLGQLEDDRARGAVPAGGSPRRTGVSTHSRRSGPAGELSLSPPGGGRRRARLGAGDDHRQADVDEHDLAVGVAVAVALLVGPLEARRRGRPGRVGRAGDRQLEGLAGVAHLVGRPRGSRAREPRSPASGDQLLDLGGDPLGAQLAPAEHHRAGGVAAALGGAEARAPRGRRPRAGRGSSRSRARRRSPPRASGRRRRRGAGRSGAGRRRARP